MHHTPAQLLLLYKAALRIRAADNLAALAVATTAAPAMMGETEPADTLAKKLDTLSHE